MPYLIKAIMVMTITEVLNRYTPKCVRPRYILIVLSVLIVYVYKTEYLIGDSLFVASLSVLAYELFGKTIIKDLLNKFKESI